MSCTRIVLLFKSMARRVSSVYQSGLGRYTIEPLITTNVSYSTGKVKGSVTGFEFYLYNMFGFHSNNHKQHG